LSESNLSKEEPDAKKRVQKQRWLFGVGGTIAMGFAFFRAVVPENESDSPSAFAALCFAVVGCSLGRILSHTRWGQSSLARNAAATTFSAILGIGLYLWLHLSSGTDMPLILSATGGFLVALAVGPSEAL